MENEDGVDNGGHDLNLTVRNDDTTDLLWNYPEYDMDALLGADANPSTGDSNNHHVNVTPSKLRKRYTMEQIQALEALFQACPHPDDEMPKALGEKIGMEANQVTYWFQNRRSQKKVKECWEGNKQIRSQNAALLEENTELWQQILEKSCFSCASQLAPPEQLSEKQRLLIANARLKEEYLRAEAILKELSGGAALPLVHDGLADQATLLRRHAECAMKEFQTLATAGVPMWLPSIYGDVFSYQEYSPDVFPRLLGPCSEGFVAEATREEAVVRGTAAYLVGILTDVDRWSKMFSSIVAAVSSRDVGSGSALATPDGLIQLINVELWVQSPRTPRRSVKIMRFTKHMANGKQWAVVDVSVDGILGVGQEGSVDGTTACRLLPSGCLIEDMEGGYCKVTWIVHAEYDETTVLTPFRALFRSGQALGARRWLATLQRQCEYNSILGSFPAADGRRGVMDLAQRMTASFYAAVSGPMTMPASNVIEWRGSSGTGTGAERFDAAVRMVTWNCAGAGVPGQHAGLVLSATTTVWLPTTPPQLVFDYLCDEGRRGEWDTLASGAAVQELGSIVTGYLHGNAIRVLRSNVTDGTNNKMVILQEACSDASCSLVVYSLVGENSILAIMTGSGHTSGMILPSGFAILPDGHKNALHAPSVAASTSNAPASRNSTTGCLLTAACQTLWPAPSDSLAGGAFDDIGKQLCHAIEKIKVAIKAEIVVPA